MDDIFTTYEGVLSGNIKRFPHGVWSPQKDGAETASRLLRYLVIEKLKLNRSEFCKTISTSFMRKYKLYGALTEALDNTLYPAIIKAFPEWKIKMWELTASSVPKGFWNLENSKEAIRWMIEAQLRWDYSTVKISLKVKTFEEHHLSGMLSSEFENSPYLAIKHAYPELDWSSMMSQNFTETYPSRKNAILRRITSK